MRAVLLPALAFGLLTAGGASLAAPVVRPGKKPGIAARWKTSGKTTTLTIRSEYDPDEVAKAIAAAVAGASVRTSGSEIAVTGVEASVLLSALEAVEVEESLDDIDAMLSELQGSAGEEGSGSSIRATKAADLSEVIQGASGEAIGKVIAVRRHRFPLVFVTLELEAAPEGLDGLAPGHEITVLPRVRARNGLIDPGDKASKQNVGAWYSQPGDRVKVHLEQRKKRIWIASSFDRDFD